MQSGDLDRKELEFLPLFIFIVFLLKYSVKQWFSTRRGIFYLPVLLPMGHLILSEDLLVVTTKDSSWHLVDRGQQYCKTYSQCPGQRPRQNYSAPGVGGAKAGKQL